MRGLPFARIRCASHVARRRVGRVQAGARRTLAVHQDPQTDCIAEAQSFIRDTVYHRDSSSMSLRDASHCVRLIPLILGLFEKRRHAEEVIPSVVRQVTHSKYTKCKQVRDALLIAITHCYAMRLNLGRINSVRRCVDAGAGLASKAWTASSSQLQKVKSSGNPTTTSLVSLSNSSTESEHRSE